MGRGAAFAAEQRPYRPPPGGPSWTTGGRLVGHPGRARDRVRALPPVPDATAPAGGREAGSARQPGFRHPRRFGRASRRAGQQGGAHGARLAEHLRPGHQSQGPGRGAAPGFGRSAGQQSVSGHDFRPRLSLRGAGHHRGSALDAGGASAQSASPDRAHDRPHRRDGGARGAVAAAPPRHDRRPGRHR